MKRLCVIWLLVCVVSAEGAVVTVAPADAPAEAKAKADLVCDGKNDEVELLSSITRARTNQYHGEDHSNSKNAYREP